MADLRNIEAERIVLGSMMLSRDALDECAGQLEAGDFYEPRHGTIFTAITANALSGGQTSPPGIAITLLNTGELQRVGGGPYLHDLLECVPLAASAPFFAAEVRRWSDARRALEHSIQLGQAAETGDPERIAAAMDRVSVARAKTAERQPVRGRELDSFLGDEPPPYEWLVPDLIERGDRIILTGGEGKGKSTLLRQIGVQLASGIHPFGGKDFAPLRVLLLDLENSVRQVHRKLHPIRRAAGERYGGAMTVEVRTEGINLLERADGDWLLALAAAHEPDILITGPAYKMAAGDPNEEGPARVVASYFDRLRKEHDCALLLEAHSPHASNGGKRPTRPYGASLWLRWPEFGLHLADDGEVVHWRGPRDEREWPVMLRRGGAWPWSPVDRERDAVWVHITNACRAAGRRLSERELSEQIKTHKSTVHRVIQEHRSEWDAMKGAS